MTAFKPLFQVSARKTVSILLAPTQILVYASIQSISIFYQSDCDTFLQIIQLCVHRFDYWPRNVTRIRRNRFLFLSVKYFKLTNVSRLLEIVWSSNYKPYCSFFFHFHRSHESMDVPQMLEWFSLPVLSMLMSVTVEWDIIPANSFIRIYSKDWIYLFDSVI